MITAWKSNESIMKILRKDYCAYSEVIDLERLSNWKVRTKELHCLEIKEKVSDLSARGMNEQATYDELPTHHF